MITKEMFYLALILLGGILILTAIGLGIAHAIINARNKRKRKEFREMAVAAQVPPLIESVEKKPVAHVEEVVISDDEETVEPVENITTTELTTEAVLECEIQETPITESSTSLSKLDALTKKELLEIAKKLKIKGVSNLRKDQIKEEIKKATK